MFNNIMLNMILLSLLLGIIVVAVIFTSLFINTKCSVHWRYWLWLILAVRLFIPLNITIPFAQYEIEIEASLQEEKNVAPQVQYQSTVLPGDSASGITTNKPKSFIDIVIPSLFPVWITGALLFLLHYIIKDYYYRNEIIQWRRPTNDSDILTIYHEICESMDLKTPPALRICDNSKRPYLIGLFRPILILPHEDYFQDEIKYIIGHELSHFVRHDIFYKAFILIVNAVHWFNPLIYILRRTAYNDIEILCDSDAVKDYSFAEKQAYCKTIAKTAARQFLTPMFSSSLNSSGKLITKRISHVLQQKKRNGRLALASFSIVAFALSMYFTVVNPAAAFDSSGTWKLYRELSLISEEEIIKAAREASLDFWGVDVSGIEPLYGENENEITVTFHAPEHGILEIVIFDLSKSKIKSMQTMESGLKSLAEASMYESYIKAAKDVAEAKLSSGSIVTECYFLRRGEGISESTVFVVLSDSLLLIEISTSNLNPIGFIFFDNYTGMYEFLNENASPLR